MEPKNGQPSQRIGKWNTLHGLDSGKQEWSSDWEGLAQKVWTTEPERTPDSGLQPIRRIRQATAAFALSYALYLQLSRVCPDRLWCSQCLPSPP